MTDEFAISYVPPELQLYGGSGIPEPIAEAARGELADLGVDPALVELTTGSHGYGAEGSSILLLLAAAFFMGKKIDESLAAWVNIAGRVRQVVDGLTKKHGEVAVSQPAAIALALDAMATRGISVDGVSLVAAHTLPVANGVIPPEMLSDFRHQSDRFYVIIFRTADQATYIVRLRSSGELEEIHRLPTTGWSEYYGLDPDPGSRDPGAR
jgi:hypothetical protein